MQPPCFPPYQVEEMRQICEFCLGCGILFNMINATIKNNMVTIAQSEYETLRDFYDEYKSRAALKRIQDAEDDFLSGQTKVVSSKKFLSNVKKWIA